MATANTIVSRALRLLGVIASGETIDAAIGADSLASLNVLGQRWLASGLLAAWTDATALTSTLDTPVSASDALAYALAVRIAPEYLPGVPEPIAQQAAAETRLLWRDRIVATSPTDRTAGALALRALRVVSGKMPAGLPDSVSLPGALVAMNAIGQRWLASGLIAAWADVDAVGDAVSTSAQADEALIGTLASRLAAEYGVDGLAPPNLSDLWRDRLAATTAAGTAEDVILRALRIIGSAGKLPDTVSFPQALGTLNALLAEMHEAGVGLPDYSVAAIDAAMTSDAGDRDALAYQLAMRLAPEYGATLTPETLATARESMSRLRLRYFQPAQVDAALPGTRYGYDIEAG